MGAAFSSRHFLNLEEIPEHLQMALISYEDSGYWHHNGVDIPAIVSALRQNLSRGKVVVGGSTITMQTVKNLFLGHEKTLARKFQEIVLAWHLERVLGKDKILEAYVNTIEFAPDVYGIHSAARHFFNKRVTELSLVESVYLASILPNPKDRYRFFCQGRVSKGYWDVIENGLVRMSSLGMIGEAERIKAQQSQLRFRQDVDGVASTYCQNYAFSSRRHRNRF